MRWSDHRAQLEAERDAMDSERSKLVKSAVNRPNDATLLGKIRDLDDRRTALADKWTARGDFAWQEDPIYLAMVDNRTRLFASTSESWRAIRSALASTDPHNFAKILDLNRDDPMHLDNIREIGALAELVDLWTVAKQEEVTLLASDPVGEDDDQTANLVRAKEENLARLANLLQTLAQLSMLAQGEEDLRAKFLPG